MWTSSGISIAPRLPSGAVALAPLGLHLHALHRQRPHAERIAEVGGDGLEVEDALGIGLFVNAIERGDALVFQIAGDALVGRQHELLDDAVGDVALRARDALHQAVLVELDDRLGQIEIDGAAAHALAVQDHRQLAHQLEDIDQPVIVLAQRRIAFEDEVDVGVGHALGRADDALVQRVADDLALMVDLHHAREHQAVDLRTQAAQVGGELDRQHGHGAVGEIDGGSAQARFQVDGRAFAHVVRNVGDVDLQFEIAVRHAAHGDGIVEVARGFAVDGDDGQACGSRAGGATRCAGITGSNCCASCSTSTGKRCGRWCLRMTISTSTPKSSS